ncbi:MAG: PIN domain-containing protein [Gemmatimonadota bacterium]
MSVFVDTSALYALFDRDDRRHGEAAEVWSHLVAHYRPLITSNYVLVETTALLQRRIGLPAVHDLEDHILPFLTVRWITEPLHRRALVRLRKEDRREVSLVDYSSFELMESEAVGEAFALDEDFASAGFRLLPSGRSDAAP